MQRMVTSLPFAAGLAVHDTFVILMFRALFAIAFCSTKRGDGLSFLLIAGCLRWPNNMGMTLNYSFDKTLRGQARQAFGVARSSDPVNFCPMRFLDEYVDYAQKRGIL